MVRSIAIAGALALMLTAAPAEAQNKHPLYVPALAVGALGGIGNSVAAIVYSLDERTFHSPFIVTTLFASAINVTLAGTLISDAAGGDSNAGIWVGIVFYLASALWPGYWWARSAIAEVEPGQKLDADVAPEETEDPIEALRPRSPPAPATPIVSLAF